MKKIIKTFFLIPFILFMNGCDDFVKIDPPRTALVRSTVFTSDATADAAMVGIYYQMKSTGFASGSLGSISFLISLSADEEMNYYSVGIPFANLPVQQFNDNTLRSDNSFILTLWTDLYASIYKANGILEGLQNANGVSADVKTRLLGEAKFIRAFCHFYLVNLWGDVPLVLTTDYQTNANISRTATADVYKQIVGDLQSAQSMLPEDYVAGNGERVRANKWAATALLARVYLYMGDWSNAETQSSLVIADSADFSLTPALTNVFDANGQEAILQLWSDLLPTDRSTFRFSSTPRYGALRPDFVANFEAGDLRKSVWTSLTAAGYYRTLKYSSTVLGPPAQYTTLLRLAEQYLIRAEARTLQNNFSGAQADINLIRSRAGLGDTPATDQTALLFAIEQERRSELFNEWGHRWFDLKRTNRADAVLTPLKPAWVSTAALFPIPVSETINNTSLKNAQNPGY